MRNYLAFGFAVLVALTAPAVAQRATIMGGTGSGSGGATEIIAGNGISVLSASPCDTSCTINTTVTNNAKTTTSESIASTDGGKLVSASNTSAQAYSIVAASTTGFTAGYGTDIHNINTGLVTLTAGGASVFSNGLQTLAIFRGQSAFIWSDGTNYQSVLSLPVIAADTVLGNFTASANYPRASAALSDCDAATSALTYDTTTHAFGCHTISAGSVAVGDITGLGTGVATLLGGTSSGTGGPAGTIAPTFTGTLTAAIISASSLISSNDAQVAASGRLLFNTRGTISSAAANSIQIGIANNSSPSAQILGFTNGSGTNIAGPNATIACPAGSGNAAQGSCIFQVGTPTSSGTGYGARLDALTLVGTSGTAVFGAAARLKSYTVATLPASPTNGDYVMVIDNNAACTYGGTPTSGGTTDCPTVYLDGAWALR